MQVYNNLIHKKTEFKSLKKDTVNMYVCGVTVYDLCHIGHARAYVSFDIIRRYLEYRGYKVKYIQNFTDVDDKIINRAIENKEDPLDLSTRMIDEYFLDMDAINIKRADIYPKVTTHIPEIISFIEKLIKKGLAYSVDGDVYYDVRKFKDYGKLSNRKLADMQAGARVDINDKKVYPLDFALWKAEKENELSWDSPWGKGRPGWHIECSAMSMKYLGATFDIHGGGHDLIFPHHENEIAQTEGLTDKPMANYWVHNGFVRINDEKMSKSLDNFFTIREVLKQVDPMALRLFFLMTHYRMPINYSDTDIIETSKALSRISHSLTLNDLKDDAVDVETYRQEFVSAMDDDFNTARALAVVFDLVKQLNKTLNINYQILLKELLSVLGIKIEQKEESIPKEIIALAEKRQQARIDKNWAKSDEYRDQISAAGFAVKDSKDSFEIIKINA
ncbi:MAG: cysteine--tRNA ligase [Candidatus Margulisbacteria bacterium GWF2_35_9]|nr:MAG: cysteine--tRNA ligase [Candidatus Margulisbacteria bacterium GWF2_35_9]